MPVGFGVVVVAVVLPCGDFVGEDLLVGDAAIETLRREHAEFGFGHVEPTAVLRRVMPFEALDEPARPGRGKGLIERGWLVGVEIILHGNLFPDHESPPSLPCSDRDSEVAVIYNDGSD